MKYIIKFGDKQYYWGDDYRWLGNNFAKFTVVSRFAKRYDTYEEARSELDRLESTCVNVKNAVIEKVEE